MRQKVIRLHLLSVNSYHEKSTTLYLGSNNVDVETAVASALADGDDNSVNNDEDGFGVITINAGMTTASITAQVFNNTGANAQLVVWVDWDKSGTFEASEAQEQNSLSSNNTLTDITLNWAGLTPITGGNYFIRARLMPSADGVTTSDIGGYASDGEVEDHLYIVTDTDYGDAPTSYGSASHFLNTETVQLGATIDYDAGNWGDGTDNNANATDDDTVDDPTGGVDDEDGIASLPDVDVATDTSYTLAVDVNNSHPTNTATLHVWFDSDGSGSFDVDEYQTATIPANTGATTENITWNGLTGLSTGTRYVRARITTDTLTTGATGSAPDTRATGLASDGEVEDYPVSFTYEHPSIVDPSTTDTDNDGVMDDIDVDDDNDGILDVDEGVASCDGASNPTYPGGYADLINFEYKQIDDPSTSSSHPDWHTNTYNDLVLNNPLVYSAEYNNSDWVTGSSGNASFEPGAGLLNHPLEVYNQIFCNNNYMTDNAGFKNVVTGLGGNRDGDQVELFRVTIPYQLAATYTFRTVGSFIWLGSADEDMAIVVNGTTILEQLLAITLVVVVPNQ